MIENLLTNTGEFLEKKLLPAVILLVVGIFIVRILLKLLKTAFAKTKMDPQLSKLLLSIARPVFYVLLALMTANLLGIDVTSIVALASVLTLAVSLSLQNALGNVFGGFTLLYTKPFQVGDFVEIAGKSGTVKEVGIAYTRLCTLDNKVISIPNSAVTAADVTNFSANSTRRLDITVSASYDAPPEKVIEVLLQMADIPQVLQEPAPSATVTAYGDSSISYMLLAWTKSSDLWGAKCHILNRLKAEFDAQGIEMTYPHLNVHLEK